MRKIFYLLLSLSLSHCFIKGQSTHKQALNQSLDYLDELYLLVSNEHKNNLSDLQKNFYKKEELQNVFTSMQEGGDIACEMIYNRRKYNKPVFEKFMQSEYYQKLQRTHGSYIPKLVSGCRNFFGMNDLNPHRDFELVNKFYPKKPKECYSVGFLQPYMMHNMLGCKKLTMIDIDWKILDGHRQMVQKFKQKQFTSKERINQALSGLDIGWIPNFTNEPIEKKAKVDINTICFSYYSEYCLEAILGFQKRFEELESVQLQLSSLHNGLYLASPDSMLVIFLSNATDKLYTSWDEFKLFLDSVYATLSEGQTALFIYHNAGRSKFGLYTMTKTREGKSVDTVCRDTYLYPRSYINQGSYITFFEYVTQTRGRTRTCSGIQL